MIFGGFFLRISQFVMSTFYLALKYWINKVVGVVKGDQRIVIGCYMMVDEE